MLMQQRGQRAAEDRTHPERDIKPAVVRGCVTGAEGIGQGRWEQRENFTPTEEHEAREKHEQRRVIAPISRFQSTSV